MTPPPVGTVLFAWRRVPPPFLIGGAEVSQRLLAEEFAAAGWRTVYLASHEPPWSEQSELPSFQTHLDRAGVAWECAAGDSEIRYSLNGVEIRAVPRRQVDTAFRTTLDEISPDLVVTSQEGSAELVRIARSQTAVAGWLHSVSRTGLSVLDGDPQHALATSKFVISRTQDTATEVMLFYPPFDRAVVNVEPADGDPLRGDDLLMVNPVPKKGSDLIHALAKLLPDRRFTLVEGWWNTAEEFARHPNVRYVPRTYDMRSLYESHRLLLVPSTVEDAFPRVITEAGLTGLPTLGSTRGGIPEAIDHHELLLPPDDAAAWAERISTLSPQRLNDLGVQAHHQATTFVRPCLPELRAAGVIPQ